MRAGRRTRTALGAVLAVGGLLLAACSVQTDGGQQPGEPSAEPSADAAASTGADPHADDESAGHGSGHGDTAAAPDRNRPLRAGERFAEIAMPAAYTPSAPTGVGTDDYRCFLLDPELGSDAFITGLDVEPGNPEVVHHVILFRVPPAAVTAAEQQDAADPGQGWTCFGGTGVEGSGFGLDDAPWLGAWAPGGSEQVMARDLGVPLERGSRVVMQVHYNLLAGAQPDVSATRLRLADGDRDLAALETMLYPAPVELPCRPGRAAGELCGREAAMVDVLERFGEDGQTGNLLHLVCGPIDPGPRQSCDRQVTEPATIRATAGHMHLLGRSIRIDVNPGTPQAERVLDVPVWDFDDQGARPIEPVALEPGDTVRVTCRHDQRLRDLLPAFEGQEERYVVWGDGTTDEMCLGMLLVTRP